MKKKLLALVIAAAVAITIMPVGMVLTAADGNVESETLRGNIGPTAADGNYGDSVTFTLVNGTLAIDGTGPMADFPGETPWENERSSITSVVVGEGITYIGANAFRGIAVDDMDDSPDTWEPLMVGLPQSLTAIGDGAFADCPGLTQLSVPGTIDTLGNGVFAGSGLTSIKLPDSITFMGTGTFENCASLTEATMPAGIVGLPENTFAGCTSLQKVTTSDGSEVTGALAGEETAADAGAETEADGETADAGYGPVEITGTETESFGADGDSTSTTTDSDSTTTDTPTATASGACGTGANWAYYDSTKTLAITGVGAMADYADGFSVPWFNYIGTLTTVTIAEGITAIGNNDFAILPATSSRSTVAVTLPSTLTKIGNSAFQSSTAVKSLTFPAALVSIGDRAFDESGLTAASMQTMTSAAATLGTGAFSNCTSLATVTLPTNIKVIPTEAFYRDAALKTIAFPETVTEIGDRAFAYSGLTALTLPSKLTKIGSGAFEGLTSLTAVTLPATVTSLGSLAFAGDTALKDVYILNPTLVLNVNDHPIPTGTQLTIHAASTSTAKTYADAKVNNNTFSATDKPLQSVTLNITSVTLEKDKSIDLTATLDPADTTAVDKTAANITWTSSDATVASVTQDKSDFLKATVKTLKAGTTTITVTVKSTGTTPVTKTATCSITVPANAQMAAVLKEATVTLGDTSSSLTAAKNATAAVTAAVKAMNDAISSNKTFAVVSEKDKGTVLSKAISAAQDAVRTDAKVSAEAEKLGASDPKKVTITVRPVYAVEVTAADDKSMTATITPTYEVDLTVNGKTTKNVSSGTLKVSGSVMVNVPLSDKLAEQSTLYVTHKLSDGKTTKYYKGSVKNKVLTFENPDGFSTFTITTDKPSGYTDSGSTTSVVKRVLYRMYNRLNGDHVYVKEEKEWSLLKKLGWNDEGKDEGSSMAVSDTAGDLVPCYQLMNTVTGEHLYTADSVERTHLAGIGWEDQGVVWYVAKSGDTPVYRLLNPNGFHHFTPNSVERNFLMLLGWKDEGIAFYQTPGTSQ